MEPRRRGYVYPTPQQFLQIGDESSGKPGRRVVSNLDEKIDVATRTGITAGDRSEDTDAGYAMPGRNPQDVVSFAGEDFVDSHVTYKNRGYFRGIASCSSS